MDLVSIITTSYNTVNYIDDCLASIYALTYPNLEFIVIDDGSTDGTWERICFWQDKFNSKFARFIAKQTTVKLGFAESVNELIRMSNGKYIKKVDSDDMITSFAIDKFVEIANRETADVYFSNGYIIGKDFKFSEYNNVSNLRIKYYNCPIDGSDITGELCTGCYISNPGTFIPKNTFLKYGLYDSKYYTEDYEFWLRISSNGARFKYVNDFAFYYRNLPNSLSHFSKTKEGIEKNYKFELGKYSLVSKYISFANEHQKFLFYNISLGCFLTYFDDDNINQIINLMRINKIKITNKNKFKYIIYKCKLMKMYIVIRDLYHFLKGKFYGE